MAITSTARDGRFNDIMIKDTDSDENGVIDITGAPGSVYMIHVTSTWGGSSIFVKFYDEATPTVGTSEPVFIMKVAASATKYCVIPDGLVFTTAISYAVTDQSGSQGAGSSVPTNNVTIRLVVS